MRTVKQFKKLFPIFLALSLGATIVVGATKGGRILFTDNSSESTDNSWKSALSVIPTGKSIALVERGDAKIDTHALSATTTTDSIARRLILEYTAVQQGRTTPLSDGDAQMIATRLAQGIKLPLKKQYQLRDLNISEDNSEVALIVYFKELNVFLNEFITANSKENALSIVAKATETKDSSVLEKLDIYIATYQKLEKNLLSLKTPSLIAPLHLRLIQSYESLRAATVGLKSVLSDPIVGLAAFTEYQKGVDALNTVAKEYPSFKLPPQ